MVFCKTCNDKGIGLFRDRSEGIMHGLWYSGMCPDCEGAKPVITCHMECNMVNGLCVNACASGWVVEWPKNYGRGTKVGRKST